MYIRVYNKDKYYRNKSYFINFRNAWNKSDILYLNYPMGQKIFQIKQKNYIKRYILNIQKKRFIIKEKKNEIYTCYIQMNK